MALTLGYVLGGAAGEFYTTGGQRDIDASFLVMMSAYHEDFDFRFPRLNASWAWQALVDTAEPSGLVSDGKLYVAGHAYKLRARSFALFINRARRRKATERQAAEPGGAPPRYSMSGAETLHALAATARHRDEAHRRARCDA